MLSVSFRMLFVLALCVATPSGLWAQRDASAGRGQAIRLASDFVQNTPDDQLERFLENHLSHSLQEELSRTELLKALRALQRGFHGKAYHGAMRSSERGAQLLFENDDGTVDTLAVEIAADSSRRLSRLGHLGAPFGMAPGMSLDDLTEALFDYLMEAEEDDAFSGSVLLAVGDEVLFAEAYGKASLQFDVPNRVDTKINLGSMNKMFTGVAICQLVEQGKLSFEDTVAKHLPDYPNPEVARKVTVHQLLTHTSGLGSYWNDRFEATFPRLRTVSDLLPLFADDPLQFEPGTQYAYSNAGPIVLGLILEEITGQSYYDYVRENIYEPCGMHDTDCYETDVPVPNLAIGYTHAGPGQIHWEGPRRSNYYVHSVRGGPAGGGYSTVEDLHRFAQGLRESKLLGEDITRVLLKGKVPQGPGFDYAYLFGVHDQNGLHWVGHNGGGPGISAEFAWFPQVNLTVAVLSNYDAAARTVAAFIQEMLALTDLPTAR